MLQRVMPLVDTVGAESRCGLSRNDRPRVVLIAGARLGGFRRFAVLDSTLVSKIAPFLRLFLTLGRLVVLVGLFLYEAGALLDLAFDAHKKLLSFED